MGPVMTAVVVSMPEPALALGPPCGELNSDPVNIRNVFKWFKHLQNIFKTYLNPILWFSKRFQVNFCAVMFKKCFINILYKNAFTENIY